MAQTRFVRANQVPASTRFIRASSAPVGAGSAQGAAPQPRQPQYRPGSTTQSSNYAGALGSLAGIGSRFARLAPGGGGVGAGLGLLSTGLSLPNLFSDRTSTPRKILGGAQALTSGASNLNTLGGATGLGRFLSPGMASGLGTAGAALGIGSGALGLAEGGGPESAAQVISGVMGLLGMGGPAALFAIPSILGPLDSAGMAKYDAERQRQRVGPTLEQARTLSAPLAQPSLATLGADPMFQTIAALADNAARGQLVNDIRVSPSPEMFALVDQINRIPGFQFRGPAGPPNIELIGNMAAVGLPLETLLSQYSAKLEQLGIPANRRAFESFQMVPPSPVTGVKPVTEVTGYQDSTPITRDIGYAMSDEHGRVLPMPTLSLAMPETSARQQTLDWLSQESARNVYNPGWSMSPNTTALASSRIDPRATLGPGRYDQLKAEWDAMPASDRALMTTARSFEEYALRQVGAQGR